MEDNIIYFAIPMEIRQFFTDVFEIQEIRGIVGEYKQIKFFIHTNDHNPPHVHAKYDNYEISISLVDYSIIVGNLPKKNTNIAIKWIKKNKDKLLNYWNEKTLVSTLPMHKSALNTKDAIKI